jgi:hypothetical protein
MTDLKRRTIATIQTWALEERWSQEQLNAILRFMNAMQWSEETDKIARAFDGLVKEIIHRDCASWASHEEPWKLLLKPSESVCVEKAIHDRNDGRMF